jgi:hypothetical protein
MPPKKFVLPRINDGADALPPMKKTRQQTKQRPEGMSNVAWAVDIQRQAVVNQDRRKWEAAAKMKKAAVMVAASLPWHIRESRKRLISDELVAFISDDFPRRARVHIVVQILVVSLFR